MIFESWAAEVVDEELGLCTMYLRKMAGVIHWAYFSAPKRDEGVFDSVYTKFPVSIKDVKRVYKVKIEYIPETHNITEVKESTQTNTI